MKVEIWADIVCPFCYIGKRRFEHFLKNFEHQKDVQVEWKSFLLYPDLDTLPGKDITKHLAEVKGWSIKQAEQMNRHVNEMAEKAGLIFNLDNTVVANSINAHRLLHFAKTQNKVADLQEVLFRAYFSDGKNIDDSQTLAKLGSQVGLDPHPIRNMLKGKDYRNAVQHDILAAKHIGIQGVPFFLFDRKYAVSGAREPEVFLEALKKAYNSPKEN